MYLEQIKNLTSKIKSIQQKYGLTLSKEQHKILRKIELISVEKEAKLSITKLTSIHEALLIQVKNKEASKTLSVEAEYPGGFKFSDFKNLKQIDNNNGENPIYILFDPEFIKDFNKISHVDKRAFANVMVAPHFCASQGKSGVKYLSGNNKAKCQVKTKNENLITEITHELKIKSSDNRILLFALKPLNQGPIVLVATQYVEGGLHTKKDCQKIYQVELSLDITKDAEKNKNLDTMPQPQNRYIMFQPASRKAQEQQTTLADDFSQKLTV